MPKHKMKIVAKYKRKDGGKSYTAVSARLKKVEQADSKRMEFASLSGGLDFSYETSRTTFSATPERMVAADVRQKFSAELTRHCLVTKRAVIEGEYDVIEVDFGELSKAQEAQLLEELTAEQKQSVVMPAQADGVEGEHLVFSSVDASKAAYSADVSDDAKPSDSNSFGKVVTGALKKAATSDDKSIDEHILSAYRVSLNDNKLRVRKLKPGEEKGKYKKASDDVSTKAVTLGAAGLKTLGARTTAQHKAGAALATASADMSGLKSKKPPLLARGDRYYSAPKLLRVPLRAAAAPLYLLGSAVKGVLWDAPQKLFSLSTNVSEREEYMGLFQHALNAADIIASPEARLAASRDYDTVIGFIGHAEGTLYGSTQEALSLVRSDPDNAQRLNKVRVKISADPKKDGEYKASIIKHLLSKRYDVKYDSKNNKLTTTQEAFCARLKAEHMSKYAEEDHAAAESEWEQSYLPRAEETYAHLNQVYKLTSLPSDPDTLGYEYHKVFDLSELPEDERDGLSPEVMALSNLYAEFLDEQELSECQRIIDELGYSPHFIPVVSRMRQMESRSVDSYKEDFDEKFKAEIDSAVDVINGNTELNDVWQKTGPKEAKKVKREIASAIVANLAARNEDISNASIGAEYEKLVLSGMRKASKAFINKARMNGSDAVELQAIAPSSAPSSPPKNPSSALLDSESDPVITDEMLRERWVNEQAGDNLVAICNALKASRDASLTAMSTKEFGNEFDDFKDELRKITKKQKASLVEQRETADARRDTYKDSATKSIAESLYKKLEAQGAYADRIVDEDGLIRYRRKKSPTRYEFARYKPAIAELKPGVVYLYRGRTAGYLHYITKSASGNVRQRTFGNPVRNARKRELMFSRINAMGRAGQFGPIEDEAAIRQLHKATRRGGVNSIPAAEMVAKKPTADEMKEGQIYLWKGKRTGHWHYKEKIAGMVQESKLWNTLKNKTTRRSVIRELNKKHAAGYIGPLERSQMEALAAAMGYEQDDAVVITNLEADLIEGFFRQEGDFAQRLSMLAPLGREHSHLTTGMPDITPFVQVFCVLYTWLRAGVPFTIQDLNNPETYAEYLMRKNSKDDFLGVYAQKTDEAGNSLSRVERFSRAVSGGERLTYIERLSKTVTQYLRKVDDEYIVDLKHCRLDPSTQVALAAVAKVMGAKVINEQSTKERPPTPLEPMSTRLSKKMLRSFEDGKSSELEHKQRKELRSKKVTQQRQARVSDLRQVPLERRRKGVRITGRPSGTAPDPTQLPTTVVTSDDESTLGVIPVRKPGIKT